MSLPAGLPPPVARTGSSGSQSARGPAPPPPISTPVLPPPPHAGPSTAALPPPVGALPPPVGGGTPSRLPAGFVSPRPPAPARGGGESSASSGFVRRKPTTERPDRPILRKSMSGSTDGKNRQTATAGGARKSVRRASDIKFEGKSFVDKEHVWEQRMFDTKPTWCDMCEEFIWQNVVALQCTLCQFNSHEDCVSKGLEEYWVRLAVISFCD